MSIFLLILWSPNFCFKKKILHGNLSSFAVIAATNVEPNMVTNVARKVKLQTKSHVEKDQHFLESWRQYQHIAINWF